MQQNASECIVKYVTSSIWNTIPKWNEDNIGSRISLHKGDITKLEIDAIANAANEDLSDGAGVNGVIHKSAGAKELQDACFKLKPCPPGDVKMTEAFKLDKVKKIIHCVGPSDGKKDVLVSVYTKALQLCSKEKLRSVAFPCISTGIFGYPRKEAADVAIETVRDYLTKHSEIERVVFCCFTEEDNSIYKDKLTTHFGRHACEEK